MSNAISLGPLLLPVPLLLVFASAGSTWALGRWLSRTEPQAVEQAVWRTLLAGVLAARFAFVYEYRALYLDDPLTLLDIRDGGWSPTFGLIGAWAYSLYRQRRDPRLRRPLRWSLLLGTAVFGVGTFVLSMQPATGQRLPSLEFTSLEGPSVQLRGYEGQPVVVNLWATWCPPCVREMPVLHQAQRQRPDVHFVFLNQGEDRDQVARWLQSQGLPLQNVLLDPQRKASAAFQQKGYPTTLFFNAKGELVSTRLGELSAATLGERLEQLDR